MQSKTSEIWGDAVDGIGIPTTILLIVAAVLLVVLFIAIFSKPIKWALKLLINAIFGFIILFIVNFFGAYIGLSISVGWISAAVAGVFGIPGIILLLLIENFFI